MRYESQCGDRLVRLSYRQVTNEKDYLLRGSPFRLFRLQVSIGSYTAGACVTGRSVAKSSSAFRIPNTEVKNPHCWRIRYKSQCGERSICLSKTWGKQSPTLLIHTAGVSTIGRCVVTISPSPQLVPLSGWYGDNHPMLRSLFLERWFRR